MKEYEKIIKEKGLPSVGQTVRSKKYGTLWRVMEKKEIWRNIDPDPKSGESRMVPGIYLLYWKIEEGVSPGVGKMMGFEYTLYDNTFALNWDIVKD
jgi:solute carrier family 9B (sodium/hydrogen exchanger), member 1/2